MSLRWRLALLFAAGTAAVVAVAGLAFIWQLRVSLNAALDDTLQARAHAVAAQVATARPLAGHGQASGGQDSGGSQDSGDSQSSGSQVQFWGADELMQVLTPAGAVLDHSQAAGQDPLLAGAQLRAASAGPVALTTAVEGEQSRLLAIPARNGGRRVIAVVGISTNVAQAAEDRASAAVWIAAPLAALAAGLAAWL